MGKWWQNFKGQLKNKAHSLLERKSSSSPGSEGGLGASPSHSLVTPHEDEDRGGLSRPRESHRQPAGRMLPTHELTRAFSRLLGGMGGRKSFNVDTGPPKNVAAMCPGAQSVVTSTGLPLSLLAYVASSAHASTGRHVLTHPFDV